jgi:hypothetical protein
LSQKVCQPVSQNFPSTLPAARANNQFRAGFVFSPPMEGFRHNPLPFFLPVASSKKLIIFLFTIPKLFSLTKAKKSLEFAPEFFLLGLKLQDLSSLRGSTDMGK